MTPESREHPRYAIALACEISDGQRTIRAQTKDLSRGGIAILSKTPVAISTAIDLAISLVFGDNSFSEPLQLKAVVVWCTRLGEQHQIGAKFAKLSRETRGYLELFLKFLEGDPDGEDEEEDRDDTPPHGTNVAGRAR